MGTAMRFPFSFELFLRLPRATGWRYEYLNGEAWLTPRPRPLLLRRSTALPVQQTRVDAEVRELELPGDRAAVAALLLETWVGEDPYRSLEEPAEVLSSEIERGLDTARFGAVAVDGGAVCAAALVHGRRARPPELTWLTVARDARERGLATALLAIITTELHARGVHELASGASGANTPSLRWHLSRGFELAPDPVREALREARGGGSAAVTDEEHPNDARQVSGDAAMLGELARHDAQERGPREWRPSLLRSTSRRRLQTPLDILDRSTASWAAATSSRRSTTSRARTSARSSGGARPSPVSPWHSTSLSGRRRGRH
jgi:GNAT superfamily N-acetyltransferase